jgi:hypothetical protein
VAIVLSSSCRLSAEIASVCVQKKEHAPVSSLLRKCSSSLWGPEISGATCMTDWLLLLLVHRNNTKCPTVAHWRRKLACLKLSVSLSSSSWTFVSLSSSNDGSLIETALVNPKRTIERLDAEGSQGQPVHAPQRASTCRSLAEAAGRGRRRDRQWPCVSVQHVRARDPQKQLLQPHTLALRSPSTAPHMFVRCSQSVRRGRGRG